MLRYALWQMRDYAVERGVSTVAIAALFLLPGAMAVRAQAHRFADGAETVRPSAVLRYGSVAAAQHEQLHATSLLFLRGILGILVFIGAVLAMQGLASNDRKNGYFRFLFAKPVRPERYYGQAFVVHWAGFVLAITTVLLVWGWLAVPVISARLVTVAGLVWLCYAGIGFLVTSATRWDWLILAGVALLSNQMWSRFGESTHPLAKLVYLLPPLPKLDAVYAAAASPTPVVLPWNSVAWLAGYGLLCFLAGLVVLHRRRLAIP